MPKGKGYGKATARKTSAKGSKKTVARGRSSSNTGQGTKMRGRGASKKGR